MEPFLRTLIDVADDNLTMIERAGLLGDHVVAETYGFWRGVRDLARDMLGDGNIVQRARAVAAIPVPSADMRRWAALGDHTVAEDVGYRDGQWRLATEVLRRAAPAPIDPPDAGWGCIGCTGEGRAWACIRCRVHDAPDPVLDVDEEQNECEVTGMERIIVTRHDALVEYLREQKLIDGTERVIPHASPDDVRGRHVIGVLPLRLAALAAKVTEIPLSLTPDQRGRELTTDEVRAAAGEPRTYVVHDVTGEDRDADDDETV